MKLSDIRFIRADQYVSYDTLTRSRRGRATPRPGALSVLHVRTGAKLVIKVSSPAVFYELATVTSFPSDVLKFSWHEPFNLLPLAARGCRLACPTSACPGLEGAARSALFMR